MAAVFGRSRLAIAIEDLLDAPVKQLRDLECQRQAGIVLASLQGVYSLPGDFQPFGQITLRPPAFGP